MIPYRIFDKYITTSMYNFIGDPNKYSDDQDLLYLKQKYGDASNNALCAFMICDANIDVLGFANSVNLCDSKKIVLKVPRDFKFNRFVKLVNVGNFDIYSNHGYNSKHYYIGLTKN